jgi:hypothetical protein
MKYSVRDLLRTPLRTHLKAPLRTHLKALLEVMVSQKVIKMTVSNLSMNLLIR